MGQYTVKLTDQAINNLKALGVPAGKTENNYNWDQLANATATFYVDQMPTTISVSGNHSLTYGSNDWLNAIKKNPTVGDYSITVSTDPNGNGTDPTTISLPSGFTWNDGDLIYDRTLGNKGDYTVQLSDQGLDHLKDTLGTNYEYPQTAADVTSHGTMTVKAGTVTVALSGNDSKTYDATATTSLDPAKYNYTATIYKADGTTAGAVTLTAGDLQFVDGNPTNVGTYNVQLSSTGEAKLKALDGNNGDNYNWTFDHTATYKINQAAATAGLAGSNSRDYNGSGVTTSDLYAGTDGTIKVSLNFPGSTTANNTYTLVNGDYDWYQKETDGSWTKMDNAPVNQGTYQLRLNATGINHIKAQLQSNAGAGQGNLSNVSVAANAITGLATFTINQKNITNVVITGNNQSKTYDSQAAQLALSGADAGLTISGDNTVSGHGITLNGVTLSQDDFDWYDANGSKLDSAPTAVGKYQAKLKASALSKIQAANPNYNFDAVNATINYEIKAKNASVAISGSDSRDYNTNSTSAADVLSKVTVTPSGLVEGESLVNHLSAGDYAWYSKNADGTYTQLNGDPIHAGTYYLKLTDSVINQLQNDNSNYSFVDADGKSTIDGAFTYTINAQQATGKLSGSNSRDYNGSAVTVDDINNGGNILVHLTYPGSTDSSTYQLQSGDYEWLDGAAPTDKGTYQLRFTTAGMAHLQAAINTLVGHDGDVTVPDSVTGTATFTINQPAVSGVTISGTDQSKTYDGSAATFDTTGLTISGNGTVTGHALVLPTGSNALTANDFDWYKEGATTPLSGAPTAAGNYQVKLKSSALTKLQAANPNYDITAATGTINYTINPKAVKVTVSGNGTRAYDGSSTSASDILGKTGSDKLTTSANLLSGDSLTNNLTASDYGWFTKNADGTYTALNGDPTNAGTYYLRLTNGTDQLATDNPNYSFTITNGDGYKYVITAAAATATLSGSNSKTYDGHAVTTAEVNSTSGNIIVKLNVPGNDDATYTLQDGDYTWNTTDHQAPKDYKQGGYTITLTDAGLSHLQAALDSYAGTGNMTIADTGLTGSATFTINHKDATVSIDSTASGSKVYDGDPASIDKTDLVSGLTQTGFVNGESLNTSGLTADKDFTWVNADGSEASVPTDAGTYHIALTADGLKQLQTDNPNYKISMADGSQMVYTIKQAAGQVVISGDQVFTPTATTTEITDDDIDNDNYSGSYLDLYPGQETIPTESPASIFTVFARGASGPRIVLHKGDLTFVDGHGTPIAAPTHPGVYYVGLTDAAYHRIQSENPNYSISRGPVGTFRVKGVINYSFQDTQNDNAQVGATTTVSALPSDGAQSVILTVPTNYELAEGQTLPTSYTITTSDPLVQNKYIKLVHKTETINKDDFPAEGKTPEGKPLASSDFTKDVKRTITADKPDGTKDDLSQSTTLTRDATYDLVTKKVTKWGAWSTSSFAEVDAPTVAGYTPSQATVPAVATVTSDYTDPKIVITYLANDQQMTYKFVDDNDGGAQVGAPIVLNGKTDQTVNTGLVVPDG